jgi:uncharacterized oxidoreductase
MKMQGNTILITGGATGIGLALAENFLQIGNNEVIVTGRREEKLREARQKFPQLHIRLCDLAEAKHREALIEWVLPDFPRLNILVNNAGIQRQIDFSNGPEELLNGEDEIDINFSVPVQLSARLIPHLREQPEAAIVNISSGLGFVPLTIVPVYCATKAALHSFSLSLRHQLRKTSIKVFEIIPPTVDTELDRGARSKRRQEYRGIPASKVAEAAIAGMARDEVEIAVGQAQGLRSASAQEAEQIFQRMNGTW